MRIVIVLLLMCASLFSVANVSASGCGYGYGGYRYSTYSQPGYSYYGASYSNGYSYQAGWYYTGKYAYQYYPYPTYTVSYNPDSAKQLEIIDKAMTILGKMAAAPAGQRPNLVEVPQQQVPRDGLAVLNVRCAACHEAGKVAEKGSRLALLNGGRLAEGLTLDQKKEAVVRVHAGDKKMMPPARPLSREERAMLADLLGIQVVEAPAP